MQNLHFRNCTIIPDSNEIEIEGEKYRLTPKEMGVLLQLVQKADQTVTRSELLKQVWGSEHGNDLGLTQAISTLRKIFHESLNDSRVIRTIPKKGYQLISKSTSELRAKRKVARFNINTHRVPLFILIFLSILIVGLLIFKPIGIRIRKEVRQQPASRSLR